MTEAWVPPPPPTGDAPVVAVDPGIDTTHQVGDVPAPNNPPPPVGWSYRDERRNPVTPDEQTFAASGQQYSMGTFVQKVVGGKLVGLRVEWHDFQGATGARGCFKGVNLMDPTPVFLTLSNRSMHDVKLKTDPAPTGAQWPAGVNIGQRQRVLITAPTGSATYRFGDSVDVSISWTPGPSGPKVQAATGGVRMLVWVFTPAQVDATAAAESPADETEPVPAGGQTAAAALLETTPERRPQVTAQGDRGIVVFYEAVRVRVDNQTGKELALAATNVGVEVDTLGIFDSGSASVEPPPVIAAGESKEWVVYTYPRAFADYVISESDWKSCWVAITWDAGGIRASARSHSRATVFLRSTLTKLPTADPDGNPVFVARIEPGARNVAVAPVTPTTTNKYMTMKDSNVPSRGDATGQAGNTPGRSVLGVDVSAYQTMDFKKLTDLVDSQGRRVWFVGVKVGEGYGTDAAFTQHWKKLSQTRFLRMPYTFLDPLNVHSAATDKQLQAEANRQFEIFKAHYLAGGGYRTYDLPPAIDFEPTYTRDKHPIPPADTSPEQRKGAWTLVTVLRTFVARLTAMFHHPPILYSGMSFFPGWYPVAKLGFAQERPGETWQDSWLDPIFDCLTWHSAMPQAATPTTNPAAGRHPSWPWPQPAGYTGRWFQGDWSIFQFGVTEIGDSDSAGLPDVDSRAFGALRTTVRRRLADGTQKTFSTNGRLDVDVWNGTLDQLVALTLHTRWDRHA